MYMSQRNAQRQSDFYFLFLPLNKLTAIINEPVKWKIITKNIETAGVSFNCFYSNFHQQMFQHTKLHRSTNLNIINHKFIFVY